MNDVCGIYMIRNNVNGKIYIGQTSTIYKRFHQHKLKLNSGAHVNKHLQHAWDIYGASTFEFSIVEECEQSILDEREIYWIAKYNAMKDGYNQTLGGGGKRGWITPSSVVMKRTGKNNATSRKVVCLNTGDVFDCIRDAAQAYNVHFSLITMCCRGKIKTCGSGDRNKAGNVWMYYDDYARLNKDEIDNIIALSKSRNPARHNLPRKVVCLSTGDIFDSMSLAANAYGIRSSGISGCCSGKRRTAGGLKWSFYDECEAG